MPKIIIIISANSEWRAVRQLFPDAKIETSPYGEFFLLNPGKLIGFNQESDNQSRTSDLLFFHGGWGKISAAGSTQYLIDRWQPDFLVNLGTCGGFADRIERGTIILVEKTIVYDIIEQMGDFEAHIAHYTTDIDLSWLTRQPPIPVWRGLIVSADRDLMVDDLPELIRRYNAVAGDWESGAIAWIAARNGVRLLILRGVSDLVGPSGGEVYGDLETFHEAAMYIMEKLVNSLPGWLEALEMA